MKKNNVIYNSIILIENIFIVNLIIVLMKQIKFYQNKSIFVFVLLI